MARHGSRAAASLRGSSGDGIFGVREILPALFTRAWVSDALFRTAQYALI